MGGKCRGDVGGLYTLGEASDVSSRCFQGWVVHPRNESEPTDKPTHCHTQQIIGPTKSTTTDARHASTEQ